MVVVVGAAIDRGLPVPMEVPEQPPVSHRSVVPDPPVTDKLIFPPELVHRLFRSLDADVGGDAKG